MKKHQTIVSLKQKHQKKQLKDSFCCPKMTSWLCFGAFLLDFKLLRQVLDQMIDFEAFQTRWRPKVMFQRHFEAFGSKMAPKSPKQRDLLEIQAKKRKRNETIYFDVVWGLVGPKSRKRSPQSVFVILWLSF